MLSKIFKFCFIQLAVRSKPLTYFGTSMVKCRYTPIVHSNSSYFHTFNSRHLLPRSVLSNRQIRLFSDDEEPPTWEEVKTEVIRVLSSFDKIAEEDVSLEAHFINDLALDSLDIVEIVMSFEDVFHVEITDDELETIFSGQDAVDMVARKLEIPFPEASL